jgi:CHRD domain
MSVISCKKDAVVSPDVKYTATLTGAQEVPVFTTNATGTFEGVFNTNTKILSYTVTYTGITPTAWHIHKGAVGVSGGVVFDIGITFTSPYSGATIALTAAQEADLEAGLFYANMHSVKSAGGEIRGQITKK